MKALQSEFKGVKYRSRTEARWAVLFHAAGISFDYEREGFALDAGAYLPDFFLPEMNLWFEVKPDNTDESERPKFAELCERSGRNGVIAYGPPAASRDSLQYYDYKAQEWSGPYRLLEDRRDERYYWLVNDERGFGIGGAGKPTDHLKDPLMTAALASAFAVAAAERFGVHDD